jgi:hypothetical protein
MSGEVPNRSFERLTGESLSRISGGEPTPTFLWGTFLEQEASGSDRQLHVLASIVQRP